MRSRRSPKRQVIGWREWVGLPEIGVERVKVKVDTGARSSALHAYDVSEREEDGRTLVRFAVHPVETDDAPLVRCAAPLHDRRWVKSSNGTRELRPVIRTQLALAGQVWPIDLTLTSRDMMGFRMLLGREAVRRRFYVDPGTSFRAVKLEAAVRKKNP